MKYIPFDADRAKAGAKVATLNGDDVKIIYWGGDENYPIVALINGFAHNFNYNGEREDDAQTIYLYVDDGDLSELEDYLIGVASDARNYPGKAKWSIAGDHSKKIYEVCKKQILRDIPKWRRVPENYKDAGIEKDYLIYNKFYGVGFGTKLYPGDYYLLPNDLIGLPKEGE